MFGRKSENILIIKTDGLAAFVAAEPLFESIRTSNANAKISLLTRPGLQRIARASPYFDQVAAMPDFREAAARQAFVRQLKGSKFARVFDLSANDEAKKLHGAMGPFRPKWHAVDPPPKQRNKKPATSALPDFSRFYSEAGLEAPRRLPDFTWALSARKGSANMQPSWFGIAGVFGLLLPTIETERRWPATNYAQLAKTMAQARIMPVMAGGKELHAFGDEIAYATPEIVDLTGKCDHLQLTALAQEALFFVSDGAEEVHLALSVGCAGVLIKKAAEQALAPKGRHVVTLTANDQLGDAGADFVWRTLDNMGLMPGHRPAQRAAAR